jgi:hypothetical protein
VLRQRYPSEVLRRNLELMPGQSPFKSTVNVMPFDSKLSFGPYTATNHNFSNGPINDWMIVVTFSSANTLRIDFEANPACYTADKFAAHQRRFVRLLKALVADLARSVIDIDLLDA